MARTRKSTKAESGAGAGYLPTGSTLLNLAMTDCRVGGYPIGKMVNVIGDSSSGKSFAAITAFAEADCRKRFRDYEFIYDDSEAANQFNMVHLFGLRVANRIKAPKKNGDPSDTIEEFEMHLHGLLDARTPFIYVQDSFDALSADDDEKKTRDNIKARRAGKEEKGSYGMAKPKKMSQILRQIIRKLEKSASILIIVSQTRDNISPVSFVEKTRNGGRALKFYASHEMWLAVGKQRKKNKMAIGIDSRIRISKNKTTGKLRKVGFPIYYDYGIDDIGSCIDFLLETKHWNKRKDGINAVGLEVRKKRTELIAHIEENDLEKELTKIVAGKWMEIEDGLKLNRKRRYT